MKWIKFEDPDSIAIAMCNYSSLDQNHMHLKVGDIVQITECYAGWYRGFKFTKPCTKKVFPESHVTRITTEKMSKIWAEIYSWLPYIQNAYLQLDSPQFDNLLKQLDDLFSDVKAESQNEKQKMSEKNRKNIESNKTVIKRTLTLPVEFKMERPLTQLSKASVLDMYKFHYNEWKTNKTTINQIEQSLDKKSIYIKLMSMSYDKCSIVEGNYEINTIFYQQDETNRITRISETNRIVVMHSHSQQYDLKKIAPLVTKDIQFSPKQKIFVGFQFVRKGPMRIKKENSDGIYRRPKGVAVLFVSDVLKSHTEMNKDVAIQLVVNENKSLDQMIEQLIKDYRVNKMNCTSVMSLQVKSILESEISDRDTLIYSLKPQYPGLPLLNPNLSLSSLSSIYTTRNVLYLTLHHCEIGRGVKTSDPNFEVHISLRDDAGRPVKTYNENMEFTEFKSVVYYHTGKPYWIETLTIPLFDQISKYPNNVHFRFVITHQSLRQRQRHHTSVAYLRLFPEANSSAFIRDQQNDNYHVLNVMKMDSGIDRCEYMRLGQYSMGSEESIHSTTKSGGLFTKKKVKTKEPADTLYVQTLLSSYHYTSDDLLANICCVDEINATTLRTLKETDNFDPKTIDSTEMKKLSLKILEKCLHLLQTANTENFLGKNSMLLLGETFMVVKNHVEYQDQMKQFIEQTSHFNVHKQILTELTKYPTNTIFIRTADWFITIAVKSFENSQNEISWNQNEDKKFSELINLYLHNLEMLSKDKSDEKRTIRAYIVKQAGSIVNALLRLCEDPHIHLAQFVEHLLENFEDLESILTSDLTMEVINSKLFTDLNDRRLIIPRSTENIIRMFRHITAKYLERRGSDQKDMIDNACSKLLDFMWAHEKNWNRPNIPESDRAMMIYDLLIETRMLTQLIDLICNIFESVDDNSEENSQNNLLQSFNGRISCLSNSSLTSSGFLSSNCSIKSCQLQKPLMVTVSAILCGLKHISSDDLVWGQIVKVYTDVCILCNKNRITNLTDFIREIMGFITVLQKHTVYPYESPCSNASSPTSSLASPSSAKNWGVRKNSTTDALVITNKESTDSVTNSNVKNRATNQQPWIEMLFLQSLELLKTLKQINNHCINPIIIPSLQFINRNPSTMSASNPTCFCHPTMTDQKENVERFVECICELILQHFLCVEFLPGIHTLRLLENFGDIRIEGSKLIKQVWDSLDSIKIKFASTFLSVFGRLTTIQNYEIRLLAAQGILEATHLNREVFTQDLITHIDQAMENSCDESYCSEMSKAFKEAVQKNLQRHRSMNHNKLDSELVQNIIRQMTNIEECSHHLQDESPISGMIVINNLQSFYKKMGRSDIISRYLMKLMNRHASVKNYTEMGFTLRELSSFYHWSDDEVSTNFFPTEYQECHKSWMLKSKLLEKSLEYFDSEDWESGLEVCQELIDGYSRYKVDFLKMSEIYKHMSEYTNKVMMQTRSETSFFVIFYLGYGFPKFVSELPHRCILLRRKCHPGALESELAVQFPDVKVERRFPTPEELIENSPTPSGSSGNAGGSGDMINGRFDDGYEREKIICYMPVKPYDAHIPEKYTNKPVKQRVLQYYNNFKLNKFAYKILLNPEKDDPTLRKIECSIIEIEGSLPNIFSIAPVIKIVRKPITPLEESMNSLMMEVNNDEMALEDFELCNDDSKKKMYQKFKDCILKYVSPVSGGIRTIIQMITQQTENNMNTDLEAVHRLLTPSMTLIYKILKIFEAFDSLESYIILVDVFREICDEASSKLDLDFDSEFNTHDLIESFKLYRGTTSSTSIVANRRPSFQVRPDDTMTLTRRRAHQDNFDEDKESLRTSIISEESMFISNQPRNRQSSISDIISSSQQNHQVPPTPTMRSICHTDPHPQIHSTLFEQPPTPTPPPPPHPDQIPTHNLNNNGPPPPIVPPRPPRTATSRIVSTTSRISKQLPPKPNECE